MKKQQAKCYAKSSASDYHELLLKHDEGFDMRWCYQIKEVDRRLSYSVVKKSLLICDVGGAQGADAFKFAEKGAFTIVLDVNEYALKKGKLRAREYGLNSSLSFVKASATNLPFKSEIFDLITCFSTLDHLSSKKTAYVAISEFSRVTRRQGHVAITVPNNLFLIGTISMRIKNLTEPDAFFEQRFTPKELFYFIYRNGLIPTVFDSEFPRIATKEILVFHFPKIFRRMLGSMSILYFGVKILSTISKIKMAKLFGARMGYLSVKS